METRETGRATTGGAPDTAARKDLRRRRREAQLAARLRSQSAERRRRQLFWGGSALAAVLVVGGLASWLTRPSVGPGGLPGPLGGPNIAQDVRTMAGQPAPPFTLPDSDGKTYTVTPGQGRPLVIVFHMGIT